MGTNHEFNSISGYFAKPSGHGPWPGLIVIQEWWGLDLQTKSIADRFALLGYLAFAPDLYHGEQAKLGDGQKAAALVQKYAPGAPSDLEKVFDAFKGFPDCTGKVGSVGFCFGGRMSLALGISRPLDAICTFYGGGMQQLFDQLGSLKSPVLGLFGDKDISIPAPSNSSTGCSARSVFITRSLCIRTLGMRSSVTAIRMFINPKPRGMPGYALKSSLRKILLSNGNSSN